jgi:hypothetical protein
MRLVRTMLQSLTPIEQHMLVHGAQNIVEALSEVAPARSPEPATTPVRRTSDGNATA